MDPLKIGCVGIFLLLTYGIFGIFIYLGYINKDIALFLFCWSVGFLIVCMLILIFEKTKEEIILY